MRSNTSNSTWSVLAYPFRFQTVVGAGLWWMVALLQFMPIKHSAVGSSVLINLSTFHSTEFWLLWLGFTLVLVTQSFRFNSSRSRFKGALIALGFLLSSFLCVIIIYVFKLDGGFFSSIATLLFFFAYTSLLFLWGVRFALLDIGDAGSTILYTACFAFLGVFIAIQLPEQMLFFLKYLAIAISIGFFLAENTSKQTWRNASRKNPSTDSGSKNIRGKTAQSLNSSANNQEHVIQKPPRTFYFSRFALGFGIDLCLLCTRLLISKEAIIDLFGSIFFVLVILCGIYLHHSNRTRLANPLYFFPAIAAFLLTAIFWPLGLNALLASSPAIVWFAWILLSSLQLSEMRESGIHDIIRVACIEKAIIIACIATTSLLEKVLLIKIVMQQELAIIWLPLIIAFFTLVSVSSSLLNITIRNKTTPSEPGSSAYKTFDQACEVIAERTRLSTREKEVMAYLGRGYTRKAISEKLFIADGTTRTHIRHIHEKMQIHRNDELIDILHDEMGKLC